jgi:hypothetical protein
MCSLFLSVLLLDLVYGHTCFLFKSQYESSMHAFGCAGGSFSPPQGVTGWVGPLKTCFTVDCQDCRCLSANLTDDRIQKHADQFVYKSPDQGKISQQQSPESGDPVPCCAYSDPNYYYTKPLDTAAMNPEGPTPYCESTMYGLTLIGQWYVTSMYNMCYFAPLD